jgi:hypothetical protein
VRNIKKNDSIDIIIREGCYFLSEAFILNPEDSGTDKSPITWRAAKNEKVILSGGKSINGKWKTKDGKIWVVDIPEAKNNNWNFRQLFVNGKRMTRARFPNKSKSNPYLYAASYGEKSYINLDKEQIKDYWGKATDAQINIVPKWRFFNQWNTIEDVEVDSGRINLVDNELFAPIGKGDWFWIEGVKEELDESEEWFLDNKNGKLYYIPGKDIPNKQKIIAPYLNRLVYIKGDVEKKLYVKNINFKNIEF